MYGGFADGEVSGADSDGTARLNNVFSVPFCALYDIVPH